MIGHLARLTLFSGVTVNGTGSVESAVVSLRHVMSIESIVLRAASVTGTADVKLEYITSPDGINFEDYADTTDVVSSTLTANATGPEKFNPFFPPADAPMNMFIQFKVTGVGTNPADTIVDAYLILREGAE